MVNNIKQKTIILKNGTENPDILNIPCGDLIFVQGKLEVIEQNYTKEIKGLYNNIKETKTDLITHITTVDTSINKTLTDYKDFNEALFNTSISSLKEVLIESKDHTKSLVENAVKLSADNTEIINKLSLDYTKQKIQWAKWSGIGLISGTLIGTALSYLLPILIKHYS